MKKILALVFVMWSGAAFAQNQGVNPLNSILLGKGPVGTGFGSVLSNGGTGQCLKNNGASPPSFGSCGSSGGGGDFSTNSATSVVNEIMLFADTSGKLGKRATGSGIARLNSGVLSAVATPGTTTTFLNGNGAFTAPLALTTTGTGDTATFSAGTLNIPKNTGRTFTPMDFGAVCNGDAANAAADTAGIKAAIDYLLGANRPYTTLDFAGRHCQVNDGYMAPVAGSPPTTFRITNGTIQMVDGGTNTYLFDFSQITGSIYNMTMDNLKLVGFGNSYNIVAKGGIKLNIVLIAWLRDNIIQGFTESGIKQIYNSVGLEMRVSKSTIQGHIGFGTFPASSTCIDTAGSDSSVTDSVITDCNTLIHFGGGGNLVSGSHLYNVQTHSIRGIVSEGNGVQIRGNYIDAMSIILLGDGGGNHFNSNAITGNWFYVFPTASFYTQGAIIYAPRAASSAVIGDLISGNSFISANGLLPPMVSIDTSLGSMGGTVSQFIMQGNTSVGFTSKTSHPKCTFVISSATSGNCDVSALLPFGSLTFVQSFALQDTTAPSALPTTFGVAGSVITAYFNSAVSTRVNVQASINNSAEP